jgi:hypothetical protein
MKCSTTHTQTHTHTHTTNAATPIHTQRTEQQRTEQQSNTLPLKKTESNTHTDIMFYIVRMTQQRFVTFSRAQRAPPAHADQRRAPRYHHTTHTRTDTRRGKTRVQRRLSVMALVSAHQQATHRTSHTHASYKTTCPAHPHDVPRSRNHCALRKYHSTHTLPHTRHTQHGTQL